MPRMENYGSAFTSSFGLTVGKEIARSLLRNGGRMSMRRVDIMALRCKAASGHEL